MSLNELFEKTECNFLKLKVPNPKEAVMNILSGNDIFKNL